MLRLLAIVSSFTALSSALPSHAANLEKVYGFCTVRDITLDGSHNYSGKVYRTEVFSVGSGYDTVISMKPMLGDKESATLERWVGRKYGFRPDRTGDPSESQHYCIEVPSTDEGMERLRSVHRTWDNASFPEVTLVRVPWVPMEATLIPDPAPSEEHRRQVAAAEASVAKAAADLRDAQARTNEALAAHSAKVRAEQAEFARKLQAYREEYKRVTGREPD